MKLCILNLDILQKGSSFENEPLVLIWNKNHDYFWNKIVPSQIYWNDLRISARFCASQPLYLCFHWLVSPLRFISILQDEISTGLDSSTTFQIVKYLRDVAHTQQSTMLISLLQPAPESYNLFDDVLLIAEGEARK